MSNQPEITSYDVGVYQIESTDPVDGGVGSVTNAPLLSLANRTKYLKKHLDDIESGALVPTGLAPLNSPALTGTPTGPTQAAGDNSTKLATDAFVQSAVNGVVSVDVAGGSTTTLTQAQYGVAIIVLTGAVTANKSVVFPAQAGAWVVVNNTTGAFTITLKTASGTGVVVSRLTSTLVYCGGTNISLQQTDFISPALTGTPTTPTPASGDSSTKVANTAFVVGALSDVGLGLSGSATAITDANALTVTSVNTTGTVWTGSPYTGTNANNQGSLLHITTFSGALYATQLFQRMQGNTLLIRYKNNGVWGGWDQLATINSPALTGTPTAPTQAAGDSSTILANTAFVQAAVNGAASVSVAGGATTTLTAAQYGLAIIVLTGAVTANKAVVFPALSGHWQVVNNTTGAFSITLQTASGTGVVVTQGTSTNVFCDGTNIALQQSDFISPVLTGAPTAPTPPVGDVSNRIATTTSIANSIGGVYALDVSTGVDLTLTSEGYGCGIISLTGALPKNISLIFPTTPGKWLVINQSTGPYTIFCTTALGAGVIVSQGKITSICSYGGNVMLQQTDFIDTVLTGSPTAPTLARFAAGTGVMNAAAVKAAGVQASTLRSIDLSVTTATLAPSDVGQVVVLTGSGGGTLVLPAANAVPAGAAIYLKSNTANFATNIIKGAGTNTIGGAFGANANTGTLRGFESALLVSDGASKWEVFSESTESVIGQMIANNQALTANGRLKLPGGLYVQWGVTTAVPAASTTAGTQGPTRDVTLPTAFPTATLRVFVSMNHSTLNSTGSFAPGGLAVSASTIRIQNNYVSSAADIAWLAIGY